MAKKKTRTRRAAKKEAEEPSGPGTAGFISGGRGIMTPEQLEAREKEIAERQARGEFAEPGKKRKGRQKSVEPGLEVSDSKPHELPASPPSSHEVNSSGLKIHPDPAKEFSAPIPHKEQNEIERLKADNEDKDRTIRRLERDIKAYLEEQRISDKERTLYKDIVESALEHTEDGELLARDRKRLDERVKKFEKEGSTGEVVLEDDDGKLGVFEIKEAEEKFLYPVIRKEREQERTDQAKGLARASNELLTLQVRKRQLESPINKAKTGECIIYGSEEETLKGLFEEKIEKILEEKGRITTDSTPVMLDIESARRKIASLDIFIMRAFSGGLIARKLSEQKGKRVIWRDGPRGGEYDLSEGELKQAVRGLDMIGENVRLAVTMDEKDRQLTQQRQTIEKLQGDCISSRQRNESLQAELTKVNERIKDLETQSQIQLDLKDQYAGQLRGELKATNEELGQTGKDLDAERSARDNDLRAYARSTKRLQKDLNEVRIELERLRTAAKRKRDQEELDSGIKNLEQILERSETSKKIAAKDREISDLRNQIIILEREKTELEKRPTEEYMNDVLEALAEQSVSWENISEKLIPAVIGEVLENETPDNDVANLESMYIDDMEKYRDRVNEFIQSIHGKHKDKIAALLAKQRKDEENYKGKVGEFVQSIRKKHKAKIAAVRAEHKTELLKLYEGARLISTIDDKFMDILGDEYEHQTAELKARGLVDEKDIPGFAEYLKLNYLEILKLLPAELEPAFRAAFNAQCSRYLEKKKAEKAEIKLNELDKKLEETIKRAEELQVKLEEADEWYKHEKARAEKAESWYQQEKEKREEAEGLYANLAARFREAEAKAWAGDYNDHKTIARLRDGLKAAEKQALALDRELGEFRVFADNLLGELEKEHYRTEEAESLVRVLSARVNELNAKALNYMMEASNLRRDKQYYGEFAWELIYGLRDISHADIADLITEDGKVDKAKEKKLKDNVPEKIHYLINRLINYERSSAYQRDDELEATRKERDELKARLKAIGDAAAAAQESDPDKLDDLFAKLKEFLPEPLYVIIERGLKAQAEGAPRPEERAGQSRPAYGDIPGFIRGTGCGTDFDMFRWFSDRLFEISKKVGYLRGRISERTLLRSQYPYATRDVDDLDKEVSSLSSAAVRFNPN
jgi:2'-5' RNA ligase